MNVRYLNKILMNEKKKRKRLLSVLESKTFLLSRRIVLIKLVKFKRTIEEVYYLYYVSEVNCLDLLRLHSIE